jgi:hypothetical protein
MKKYARLKIEWKSDVKKTWWFWRDWPNRGESEIAAQRLQMNS